MFLDRIFGLMGAAAFVLGIVCQVGWLIDVVPPSRLYDLTWLFVGLSTATLLYFLFYVGKRDGLTYSIQGELDLTSMLPLLPAWARTVTYWLLGIGTVLLFATVVAAFWPEMMPVGRCIPGNGPEENCLMGHFVASTMTSMFGAIAFAEAIYLLRTSSRK